MRSLHITCYHSILLTHTVHWNSSPINKNSVVFVVRSKNSAISEWFATVCHWNNTSFSRAIWKEVGVTNLGETKITLKWHRDNALITSVFIAKPKILCLLAIVSSSHRQASAIHIDTLSLALARSRSCTWTLLLLSTDEFCFRSVGHSKCRSPNLNL